jgi:hypothetical protein
MEAGDSGNHNTATTCGGSERSSQKTGSSLSRETVEKGQKSTRRSRWGHSRDGEDDEDQENREGRNPKRPRTFCSPPRNQDDDAKYACPYRKRNPRKYCVQTWRSCALTPLESIARVK